jgi:hypothetical protein
MNNLSDPSFWIPTAIALSAVVLAYFDLRRKQQQDRMTAQQTIKTSRQTISLLATLIQEMELMRVSALSSQLSNQQTKQQALLQKKEQDEWNRLKDVGKAIGWILDRAEEDQYKE